MKHNYNAFVHFEQLSQVTDWTTADQIVYDTETQLLAEPRTSPRMIARLRIINHILFRNIGTAAARLNLVDRTRDALAVRS